LIGPAVSDQLDVLNLLTARLDGAGLPYLITGSIAAGLYGQPRMTRVIDIVAALHPAQATRLAALSPPDGSSAWCIGRACRRSVSSFAAIGTTRSRSSSGVGASKWTDSPCG